jgi:hypothetical protein
MPPQLPGRTNNGFGPLQGSLPAVSGDAKHRSPVQVRCRTPATSLLLGLIPLLAELFPGIPKKKRAKKTARRANEPCGLGVRPRILRRKLLPVQE